MKVFLIVLSILFISFLSATNYEDCNVYGNCDTNTTELGNYTYNINNTYYTYNYSYFVTGAVNATQMTNVSVINIKESWLETFIHSIVDSIFTAVSVNVTSINNTKNIQELLNGTGIYNQNGNVSWNQSFANSLYAPNTTAGIQHLINSTGIYANNYNHTLSTFDTYNSTWDNNWLNIWGYNQTLATYNIWGSQWYNHSLSTYTAWNDIWSSTYNSTYANYETNVSRNWTSQANTYTDGQINLINTTKNIGILYNETSLIFANLNNNTNTIQQLLNGTNMRFANVEFNDGWTNGGVSILDGSVYAQSLYVYNISQINVNNINTNGSILPTIDNSFSLGNSSYRWKNLFLSGDLFSNGSIYYNNGIDVISLNETNIILSVNTTKNIQELLNHTGIYASGVNHTEAVFNQWNSTWDNNWVNVFAYNHTSSVFTLWGQWFYNQTQPAIDYLINTYNVTWSSTFNATYQNYASNVSRNWTNEGYKLFAPNTTAGIQYLINGTEYNFSEATYTAWNDIWSSTFNQTYQNYANNVSRNHTLLTLPYFSGFNTTNNIGQLYNVTASMIANLSISQSAFYYNHTLATYNQYNTIWSSTYNSTYANYQDNVSRNWTAQANTYTDGRITAVNTTGQLALTINTTKNIQELYNITASMISNNSIYAYQVNSNTSYLTTFNQTYQNYADNVSRNYTLQTFTNWNSTWDNSWGNIWFYNQTLAAYNIWGSNWYNHTLSTFDTYNSTWDNNWVNIFAYNHTLSTYTAWNDIWSSTFNATYQNYASNVSRNWTLDGYNLFYNKSSNIETGIFNVTAQWFNGKFNWTSNDDWNIFNGSKLDFNESKLATTYYNASLVSTIAGTPQGSGGEMNFTYDGISYNVSEAAGSPGLDVRLNFTGVTNFNEIAIRYRSTSLENHQVKIQMYSYPSLEWENYGYLGEVTDFEIKTLGVYDPSSHIENGVVQLRFYQDENGNTNHKHYFDMVTISSGYATLPGQEIDPKSWHRNSLDSGNFNTTGNVTSDTFFGKWNGSSLFVNNLTASMIANLSISQMSTTNNLSSSIIANRSINQLNWTYSLIANNSIYAYQVNSNTSYLTTFNQTYQNYADNVSRNYTLQTFTNWNSTWDNSWGNIWFYNQTLAAYNIWGSNWYNHTLSTFDTYNSTWDNNWVNIFAYNHSLSTYTAWNDIWSSTFNATYQNYASNVSRNWTLDAVTGYNSTWTELSIIKTTNTTANIGRLYNVTASMIANLTYSQMSGIDNLSDSVIANRSINQLNWTYSLIANNSIYAYQVNSNTSYLTTFNQTYQNYADNVSRNYTLQTFTNWNSTWDNSWGNIWFYNQTLAAYNIWGSNWYNHTLSTFDTYNSTWDNNWVNIFAYNHSLSTYTAWNDIWSSTFNATYQNYASNVSRNWTLDAVTGYNSTWTELSIIKTTNSTANIERLYNVTASMIANLTYSQMSGIDNLSDSVIANRSINQLNWTYSLIANNSITQLNWTYSQIANNSILAYNTSLNNNGAWNVSGTNVSLNHPAYNVGIGTINPLEKLEVTGNIALTNWGSAIQFGSNNDYYRIERPLSTNDLSIITTNISRIYVTSTGNVGIGTTNPTQKLDVTGKIMASDSVYQYILKDSDGDYGNWSLTSYVNSGLSIHQNQSISRLMIDSSGNVGIGTSSPSSILETYGLSPKITIGDSTTGLWNAGNISGEINFKTYDNSGIGPHNISRIISINDGSVINATTPTSALAFYTTTYNTEATEKMRISSDGNIGIGTSSPNQTLSVSLNTDSTLPALGLGGGALGILTANVRGLIGGNLAGGNFFMQVQRTDGTATVYNLLLQPNGGNVGIGTTAPTHKLNVVGNVNVTGNTSMERINFDNGGYIYSNSTTTIIGHT